MAHERARFAPAVLSLPRPAHRGPTHPDVGCSLGNLACVRARQQQRAQTHQLLERARQLYLAMRQASVDLAQEDACGVLRQQTETLRA